MTARRVAAIALLAIVAPRLALADDSDGDGVDDLSDAWPCDAAVVAEAFHPAEAAFATTYFEEGWPQAGDLDFNDVVIATHTALRLNAEGAVSSLRLDVRLNAAGGTVASALRLSLGEHTTTASASLRLGSATHAQRLHHEATESELVYTLIPDVHRAFSGRLTNSINTDPAQSFEAPPTLTFTVTFSPAISLAPHEVPLDLFLARAEDPGHQTHLPKYPGTSQFDQERVGTVDDGSTQQRAFVTKRGIPFAMSVPEDAHWAIEGTPAEKLWPLLTVWAQQDDSGRGRDFYRSARTDLRASYNVAQTLNIPSDRPRRELLSAPDLSCTGLVTWVNPVGVRESTAGLTYAPADGTLYHGASSAESLPRHDGYLEFRVPRVGQGGVIGLAESNEGPSAEAILYAWYTTPSGELGISRSGVRAPPVAAVAPNDVLRVEIKNQRVLYIQNGFIRHAHALEPGPALHAHAVVLGAESVVTEVRLVPCDHAVARCTSTGAWHVPQNVDYEATRLTKLESLQPWGCGAASIAQFACLDGRAETLIEQVQPQRVFGLTDSETPTGPDDITFAWHLGDNAALEVWEYGRFVHSAGSYSVGDVLAVELRPDGRARYLHNGGTAHVGAQRAAAGQVFRLGATLKDAGASLSSLSLIDGSPGCLGGSVRWQNAEGVSQDGPTVRQDGTETGWNHGASSVESLVRGNGYVEATITETDTFRVFGLSHGDSGVGFEDVDFGFLTGHTGALGFYEFGEYKVSVTFLEPGDVLRVEVIAGQVYFLQNGIVRHIASRPPEYPLLVDLAYFSPGASLRDFKLFDCRHPNALCTDLLPWTNVMNVEATPTRLTKPSGTDRWDGAAVSRTSIRCQNGYVESVAAETDTGRLFGLGSGNPDPDFRDLDFALYLRIDGVLAVWEYGRPIAELGRYATGDRLRVQVEPPGRVKYFHNDRLRYTSVQSVPPNQVFYLDASMSTAGATLEHLRLVDLDPSCTGVNPWRNVDGLIAQGYSVRGTSAPAFRPGSALTEAQTGPEGGYLEFMSTTTNTRARVGVTTAEHPDSILWGGEFGTGGVWQPRLGGQAVGPISSYDVQDHFVIQFSNGAVRWFHNGNLVHMRQVGPIALHVGATGFIAKVEIDSPESEIRNVRLVSRD